MNDPTTEKQDRLHLLWDSMNEGREIPAAERDLEIEREIASLMALDNGPEPSSAFLVDLRARLTNQATPRVTRTIARSNDLGLVSPFPRLVDTRSLIRWTVAVIAAALLIAALSSGSGWLPGSNRAPMVASAMASYTPIHQTPIPTPVAPVSPNFEPKVGSTTGNRNDDHPFLTLVIKVTLRDG